MKRNSILELSVILIMALVGCKASVKETSSDKGDVGRSSDGTVWKMTPPYNFMTETFVSRSNRESIRKDVIDGSRFEGIKIGQAAASLKPVLIYIANDSGESLMQISVKFDLKNLIDICEESGSTANWIAFVGTLVVSERQARACVNGKLTSVNFPIDTVATKAVYEQYPFTNRNNISGALIKAIDTFGFKEHQYFVTIKSHGAPNLPMVTLTQEQVDKKNSVASNFLKDIDRETLLSFMKIGFFDKAIVDQAAQSLTKLGLGYIDPLNPSNHWTIAREIMDRYGESYIYDLPKTPSGPRDGQMYSLASDGGGVGQGPDGGPGQGFPGPPDQGGGLIGLGAGDLLSIIERVNASKENPFIRFIYLDTCRPSIFKSPNTADLIEKIRSEQSIEYVWSSQGSTWYRNVDYRHIFNSSNAAPYEKYQNKVDLFNAKFIDATSNIQFRLK